MIGNTSLGQMGRLGNQMWQVAFLIGMAKHHNYSWCIPTSGHSLFDIFTMTNSQRLEYKFNKVEREATHIFDPYWIQSCPDDTELQGYWQNYRYWQDFSQDILDEFQFLPCVLQSANEYINTQPKNLSSLHVRRTDYINANWHIRSMDYYNRALELLPQDHNVLVVSDDITWCKNQPVFSSNRFIFYTSNNPGIDMAVISLCKNHIMSNSSFSWWAAWLSQSPNKIVVSPKPWITKYPDFYKDLVLPSWHEIDQT